MSPGLVREFHIPYCFGIYFLSATSPLPFFSQPNTELLAAPATPNPDFSSSIFFFSFFSHYSLSPHTCHIGRSPVMMSCGSGAFLSRSLLERQLVCVR